MAKKILIVGGLWDTEQDMAHLKKKLSVCGDVYAVGHDHADSIILSAWDLIVAQSLGAAKLMLRDTVERPRAFLLLSPFAYFKNPALVRTIVAICKLRNKKEKFIEGKSFPIELAEQMLEMPSKLKRSPICEFPNTHFIHSEVDETINIAASMECFYRNHHTRRNVHVLVDACHNLLKCWNDHDYIVKVAQAIIKDL